MASTVATHFDKGRADAEDPVDRVSCRPDFAILVYPVISFTEPFTHQGSRKNLLGENPGQDLVERFSNEITFLWLSRRKQKTIQTVTEF